MNQSTITHHTVGEIDICQTLRSRRISICVRANGKVRISLPYNVAVGQALQFLDTKVEWIVKAQKRLEQNNPVELLSMPYSTRKHSLWLEPSAVKAIQVKLLASRIVVRYPLELSYENDLVQAAIKKGIEAAWRIEAKDLLPERLSQLAMKFGLKFNRVAIRNTVSKWGSCSSKDDISLSLRLMRLPDYLIDYVLIHELCHTIHKNHGEKFHSLLEKLTDGRHRELNKELRQFHARW